MSLDFNKLDVGASKKLIEPRKIFTTLKRNTLFRRPLDEQADVLDAWYMRRDSKHLTIKMNTGGGKTVVGLLCLQSSLNENIKPAVYVTPDNFLVSQVMSEARKLGINVTDDTDSSDFLAGRAILVTNIWKIFNGRSSFGVKEKKIPIGCIVIDDAHACLGVVKEQFSIKVKSDHPVYKELLTEFEEDLDNQSPARLLDLKAGEPNVVMKVPYWAWQSRKSKVMSLLHAHRETDDLKWNWSLLQDCIPLCSCYLSGTELEISPENIPIEQLPSFTGAERRIYMTATLADDAILVSHFGADANEVTEPIRPNGGGDIGDRMILIPQEINPDFNVVDIQEMITNISESLNVVVIVPSTQRAKFWEGVASQTLNKDNIKEGVEKLKKEHVGLTILVNKYDGVDLPGNACELLVIDGLPEAYTLSERYKQLQLDGTKYQLAKQIQRIEQGMGRGVRSSDDYCAVLLLGGRLAQRLHDPEAESMFSPATQAQIILGKSVTEQIQGQSLEELRGILELCFNQNDDWVKAGRSAVVNAEPIEGCIDKSQVLLYEAFDHALLKQYEDAIEKVQEAVNETHDKVIKGYYKEQLAAYVNFINREHAQEIQLSALKDNRKLLNPISGISINRLNSPTSSQAIAAKNFMAKFKNGNELRVWVNALLECLIWSADGSKQFEKAIFELGLFLGFNSSRPEEDTGRGPDNLWAIGDLKYFVIECKSGAVKSQQISKQDTNQLSGSIHWFKEHYDRSCSVTPIMIHPKRTFEYAATPAEDLRLIEKTALKKLKDAIKQYSIALAERNNFKDNEQIEKLMVYHKFSSNLIESEYLTKV